MFRKLVFVGSMLVPAIAVAQPMQGLYVGAEAGANFTGTLDSAQKTTEIQTDPGPLGLLDLGWGFGNGLRAEIEGSVRSNSVSGISTLRTNGQILPLSNTTGSARTYAAMANIAYDVPLHPFSSAVQPYLGAGAGYAWLDFHDTSGNGYATFRLPLNNTVNGPDLLNVGSAGAFAFQAFAGLSVPLLPNLSATFEYRFFGTARADVPVTRVITNGDLANGVVPHSTTHNGYELADNAVMIGIRYSFGRPPAPVRSGSVMPAPAAISARSFLVFFDWDKATLTDRARQIVAEAASTSTKVQHTRIEVNGYTDTSGTPKYNQALSVRRAEAVAAELVKDSVPRAAISIEGFGETHPLVPTGAGVREPQNRRVEIIIR